ncbi:tetratricopeptide repeat protein [Chungangia koreensis]|uniref:Tetratricopeptide repeat protein n=1 Tax=Chungangia koreensis TaxID=752657 RepID=A0ABV8X647_9LACT
MLQSTIENDLSIINHLFAIDRYEEAEKHIQNILKIDPNNSIALYKLAVVQSSYRHFSVARDLCRQALIYDLDEETGFLFIGTMYHFAAERAFLDALKVNPESGTAYAAYGYLMLLALENDKALSLFEEALRLEPDNPCFTNGLRKENFNE